MKQRLHAVVLPLTFAGALPFLIACLLKVDWLQLPGVSADEWLWSYAVVISAFMAGSHWGLALRDEDPVALISSNACALLIFGLAVWLREPLGLLLLIGVFVAQLFLDQKFKTRSAINNRYWRLRLTVTSIVCVFLTAYLIISIIAD
ncbi:DUF3429 domain-containing protein [Arenicellales bacterium IMCC55707]|jgi:hypothetical protein